MKNQQILQVDMPANIPLQYRTKPASKLLMIGRFTAGNARLTVPHHNKCGSPHRGFRQQLIRRRKKERLRPEDNLTEIMSALTTQRARLHIITLLLVMMLIPGVLQARFVREEKRIEYLLQAVASLKGAVFIRNGNDYDAKTAGSHLRLKLKYEGDRVQTAEDFIEICASRSSLTGNAYQIRLADGTIIPATTFFRAQLRLFDDIHKKVPVQPVPI